eukprot:CAMPEP_0183553656 /NCGR_PEP_ID=MMETSP0371-20130417/75361_1 /TAXON_ID=268820 /ORGANISM="Peridinium aciculiferum, Strain PAER-2" /LENGTH=59 /DNA_ID=CAMNT_0025759215 /DNA_START=22 /DNA_END=198 /DNA_ORIENTATION=-
MGGPEMAGASQGGSCPTLAGCTRPTQGGGYWRLTMCLPIFSADEDTPEAQHDEMGMIPR